MIGSFLRSVGAFIIMFATIAALYLGITEVVAFIREIITNGFSLEATTPHMQNVALSGAELALNFLGWKAGKDYIDEEERKYHDDEKYSL